MDNRQLTGSLTARGGFENEIEIVAKFNNFRADLQAQKWLEIMGYDWKKISALKAVQIPPRINISRAIELGISNLGVEETIRYKKADIQIRILIVIDGIHHIENTSLKKANIGAGFNQIDKRPVDTYQKMWGFNDSIAQTLKLFTGELPPSKPLYAIRDSRRMYFDEIDPRMKNEVVSFFAENKTVVATDILKGRGALSANWILVTRKDTIDNDLDWVLKDINFACNFFAKGAVTISAKGGLTIGKITVQRKGGTPDPTSLQFKINPLHLFDA